MNNTIAVIIPAFNESHSISKIVNEVFRYIPNGNNIVVDDGSGDYTGKIARDAGAKIIRLKNNSGTAHATRIGLQAALKYDADGAILLDADGQHDPKYIPFLINELNKGADLVFGSRYIKQTKNCTSFLRRIGTKIISILIKSVYGQRIYDPTSGFRAMNKRTLEYLAQNYPTVFAEPEVVIDLIKKGYKIREIPIQMKPRMYGRSSIRLNKAVYLMAYIIRKMLTDLIKHRNRVNYG